MQTEIYHEVDHIMGVVTSFDAVGLYDLSKAVCVHKERGKRST